MTPTCNYSCLTDARVAHAKIEGVLELSESRGSFYSKSDPTIRKSSPDLRRVPIQGEYSESIDVSVLLLDAQKRKGKKSEKKKKEKNCFKRLATVEEWYSPNIKKSRYQI